MDNPRGLTILKKCVNSTSSLQTFVEGIEKSLSKDFTNNVKAQSKFHVVNEIVNISDIETYTFGPALVETVFCAGVEPTFETTFSDGEIIAEVEGDMDEFDPVQGVFEVDVAEELELDTSEEVFEAEMVVEQSVEEEMLAGTTAEVVEDENIEEESLAEIEADDVVNEENDAKDILDQIEEEFGDLQDKTELDEKLLTRKRRRDPKTWTRNLNKMKRNLGECYKNLKSGKSFPAKSVQPGCAVECSHRCTINFNDSEREEIFMKYWQLGDVTKQREFVTNSIDAVRPKYRYIREGSSRKNNNAYHFLKNEYPIRVCKKFFCNTLNISAKTIDTAVSKFVNNVIQPDLRGTHKNHQSISAELHEGIKCHINSFERIESHYLRNQTKREFIDGSLNVSLMYRMYKDKCISEGVGYAKQHIYEHIFNYNFNIGFFKPKKDQCIQCFQYENSSEDEKKILQEEHGRHIQEKELSRQQKEEDKKKCESTKNLKVLCMDLQAVIPVPCGDISSFFYKRRLLCFNFTIFELFTNEGFCFLWHEGIAHRGSDEIGACLNIYLSKCSKSVEHVVIWSDNCSGQNKNKFLLSLLIHLVQIYDIKSISQKFLIVGHTQNEGDNMHSLIEKNKARCLKSGPIFTCDQLVPIIQLAKKTKPFYKVHQLQSSEVYDLKDLCPKTGKNFTRNELGEKVVWADVKELLVEKLNPNVVKYKTSFADTDFKSFKVSNEPKYVDLKPAYPNGPPQIPTLKKKDLMDLCRQNSIIASHHQFFQNLKAEEIPPSSAGKRRRAGA